MSNATDCVILLATEFDTQTVRALMKSVPETAKCESVPVHVLVESVFEYLEEIDFKMPVCERTTRFLREIAEITYDEFFNKFKSGKAEYTEKEVSAKLKALCEKMHQWDCFDVSYQPVFKMVLDLNAEPRRRGDDLARVM